MKNPSSATGVLANDKVYDGTTRATLPEPAAAVALAAGLMCLVVAIRRIRLKRSSPAAV